jgi:hypothetical protein
MQMARGRSKGEESTSNDLGRTAKSVEKRRMGIPADRSRDTRVIPLSATQDNPYVANSVAAQKAWGRNGYFVRESANINNMPKYYDATEHLSGKQRGVHDINKTGILQNNNGGSSIIRLKDDIKKAKRAIKELKRNNHSRSFARNAATMDIVARELTKEFRLAPNCPKVADRKWDDCKNIYRDPISFALSEYAIYRHNGMVFADLLRLDHSLYKAFSSRCYYLGKSPRAVFETIDESVRPFRGSKALKAKADGLIAEEVVKCPRKSQIGKTITVEEYREQRLAYDAQLKRVRRRIKGANFTP